MTLYPLRAPLLAALSALALLASGCNSSDSPAGASGAAVTPSSVETGKAAVMGTRTSPAGTVPAVTGDASQAWVSYSRNEDYPNTVELPKGFITMADGTRLAYTVTLPAGADGKAAAGTFPVILVQTSYNKAAGAFAQAIGGADPYMVKRGYATVVVDVRGTGNSQGVWDAFGEKEQADYNQVVNWAATQPWSNGNIGVYGVSYLGITAILTAAQGNPAVKAAFPIVPIGDGYRDIVFTGGQVNPTFIPLWMALVTGLGAIPVDALQTNPAVGLEVLVSHLLNSVTQFQVPTILKALLGESETAYDSAFWKTRSPLEQASKIKVPTFVVGGLHDLFQRSEPMWFEQLKDQTSTKLLIGPWTHIESAGLPSDGLPRDGVPTMQQIQLMWFDQYLKGLPSGADRVPNVTQYVKGLEKYVTATDWPHPQVKAVEYFLRGDKSLSPSKASGDEASSTVAQLPVFGLCSLSLNQWTAGALGFIPLPCNTEDTFNQIPSATFRTPPQTEDLYINGPIEADVWITTTGLEAGLSVRVSSYDPSTRKATALTNGLLTASHRAVDDSRSRFMNGVRIQPWHPFTREAVLPVNINEPMLLPVEVFPTSALIPKGHQLQISINSSNLPQGLQPVPQLLKGPAGVITVLNSAKYPSKVVIPVVPNSALN
ncbi:MAG: CocE/NonD family hydrolase [Limnobacter sp.]|uniref:CocE/NonD family hydrolase n=1 Tax=Limnobacter sp. TaxID=2003368 RepID=UPI003919D50D